MWHKAHVKCPLILPNPADAFALPFFELISKAFMNRSCLLRHELPGWGARPRLLVLAVLAALPGALQAQALPPLQVDPRLLGVPVASQSQAAANQSQPAAADKPRTVQAPPAPVVSKPVVATPSTPPATKAKPVQAGSKAHTTTTPAAPASVPRAPGATVIEAGRIDGREQVDMTAVNNVRLERDGMVLTGDRLYYDQVANDVQVQGNVKLKRGTDSIEGPSARINLDTWFGEFDSPSYQLQRERKVNTGNRSSSSLPAQQVTQLISGSGQADLLQLEGENHYRLSNSTYTTCPAPNPSWYLRMSDLALDFDRDKGVAKNSRLVFKGVPILYTPWAEFPLSEGRQSGVLPPTVGGTTSTGFEMTLPYYFNLAPNYDATLAPRWMSARGLQLGGEGRYLTSTLNGTLRGEYLPEDKVTQTSRSLVSWKHNQNFGYGLSGAVDLSQVSDKTYFADLSSKIASTSTSTLNQQGTLDYNSGSWLSGSFLMQRYQVITGDTPYSRKPQISMLAKQADFHGLSLALPVSYTDFGHPTQVEGRRTTMNPQMSFPMQSSAFYLTPKLGVHLSQYSLDRRGAAGDTEIGRSVPMASLDSGVVFERSLDIGGKEQTQTLEPRVYYVRTAYRDQSQIPVFDTALADFNFAQIFSENRYSGQDRIADANQVTAGVQSRMIDTASGEEWLRLALAQRYYYEDQRVLLPGETQRTGSVANMLGAVSGRVRRDLWMDNALQYDPRVGLWQRATTGLRYQPDFSKVASISYRYQRDEFRDLDVSVQWPLWGNWYGVGRYDRNLRDHRLTEGIIGLEFKGDCWVFRGVWQTLVTTPQTASQTTTQTRSNSVFLQLEFNGLASIGSNPVNLLKRSVNGYGKINDPGVGDPMFGNSAQP
ncbi:MAG: organic solvent tolerance transrane protein [Proteobacteria bacterium]|nr:organic solvent tolerance transrane protein [Pseudomonadota bacterium]